MIDIILLKKESIFIKKYIGIGSDISLQSIVNKYVDGQKGYLKVDIEGSEYNLLDEIINYKQLFNGIAIEFHDVSNHIFEINNFISKINKGLIGFKINEIGGMTEAGIPNTIEICFASMEFVDANEYDIICGKYFSNDSTFELLLTNNA